MAWVGAFRRWVRALSIGLTTVGAVALMAMMFLIAFDVMGRDLLNQAIIGTFEMVQYLMIPTVFLALAFGQLEDVHINVDVAIQFISGRKRAALNVITLLLTLAVFVPMAWVSCQQTVQMVDLKQVSQVLLIPRWPFQGLTVVGVAAFCLAILADLLVALAGAAGIELEQPGKESGPKLAAD